MKYLKKLLMGIAYLLGFWIFLFAGCEVIKHSSSSSIRELCNLYPVGQKIRLTDFVRERINRKIMIGLLQREDADFKPIGRTFEDDAKEAALIDEKKLSGRVSVTTSFGFEKYTCTIQFAGGQVTSTKSGWWD